jgi:hypothetical protein
MTMDTGKSIEAEEKEEQGLYLRASELYFRSAAERIGTNLNEQEVDPSLVNISVAELLRAIYCALRADEPSRASDLRTVFEGTASIVRDYADADVFPMLIEEFTGDCQLFLGLQNPIEQYDHAAELYERINETEQISWGMEPEFIRAHWVFEDFLQWNEIELPESTRSGEPLTTDFRGRVEIKKELYEQISGKE